MATKALTSKDLTKLVRQRDIIKVHLSNEAKRVDGAIADGSVTAPMLRTAIGRISSYQEKFSQKSELVLDYYFEIEDSSEADKDIEAALEFDNEAVALVVKYQDLFDSLAQSNAQSSTSMQSGNSAGSQLQQQGNFAVKLPELEIQRFNGDPMKWQEFWDSFKSTIHDNDRIKDIDKFKYLKGYLTEEPLNLTSGYDLTANNYRQVIEALSERYGNKQSAIFAHIMAMLNVPEATSQTKRLQAVYDECEKHIRSLAALEVPESTFGLMFTPIIMSKLPAFVQMELGRRQGSNPWTLEDLRRHLRDEIRIRSSVHYGNGQQSQSKAQQQGFKPQDKRASGKSGSATASQLNNSSSVKKDVSCAFCAEAHYSEKCSKYPTMSERKIQAKGKCFCCLRDNHSAKNCQKKRPCFHCKNNSHHSSLCPKKFGGGEKKGSQLVQQSQLNAEAEEYLPTMAANQVVAHNKDVFLKTALAFAVNLDKNIENECRLLFDDAGSRTFITAVKAKQLGLKIIGEDKVSVAGFEDQTRRTKNYKVVKFHIRDRDGELIPIVANVTDHITADIERRPIDLERFPFVRNLTLAEPLCEQAQSLPVEILLAGDYYYDFMKEGIVKCDGGMVFVPSRLGYLTAGVSDSERKLKGVTSMLVNMGRGTGVESGYDLEKFWRLEEIGVKEQIDTKEDDLALQKFKDSVKLDNGRYQVKWPWASDHIELSDTYGLAKARLCSILRKLKGNTEVMKTYEQTLQYQLDNGIIEIAPERPTGKLVYYMPHHCVFKPTSVTTKVRVVFDASAKASPKHNSLNDCLLRGPLFMSNLCGLMMRFRLSKVGIVADIEKAFLQVELQEEDRDVARFLWVKDIRKAPTPDNLITMRFKRVFFGAKASTFLLEATVRHHLLQHGTPNAMLAADNLYIDNVIVGKQQASEACEFYRESKPVFQAAAMNLREWFTNSPEFQAQIPEADRGKDSRTRVLGMIWDTTLDTLSCSVGKPSSDGVTKRKILQELASVYDPCGWFSPVTVSGKMLMQDIWAAKHGWDDQLPNDLRESWAIVASSLQRLPSLHLPRMSVALDDSTEAQLHVFSDASKRVYAACGYLRVQHGNEVDVALVFSRNRVNPLKPLTIPKLELMGVVIGTRLLVYLKRELRLGDVSMYLWSDSQCVLHWLKQASLKTVFVQNRVREITGHKDVTFRYVPSKDNPADLITKGCSTSELRSHSLWWSGPEWLKRDMDQWPVDAVPVDLRSENEVFGSAAQMVQTTRVVASEPGLVDISRFSRVNRLVRAAAWVLRFSHNCKSTDKWTGVLSPREVQEAMRVVIKQVQRSAYAEVLSDAKSSRMKHMIRQLNLFVDPEGIIRCQSRFAHSGLPETAKSPILLPRDCAFTTLVIRDRHERLAHAGIPHVLSRLRQEFWIVHGRSQVKKVIGQCVICRKVSGGPFVIPNPPDLPAFRVTEMEPFSCVGIDYLGPLYIHAAGEEHKVWVCVFACAVVRAIHLEVVTALSADQFLLCLRRFIALYGLPRVIVSDNASQFHLTLKSLSCVWQDVVQSRRVQDFASSKGISWKFIVEKAPWMGGMYERLIKSVKDSMKRSLSRQKLSLTELQTLVLEIAAILNSRPLTYVEDGVGEESLTPGHFLLSGRARRVPIVKDEGEEFLPRRTTSKDQLILEWRRIQAVIHKFWDVWRNQYLLGLLQERGKGSAQRATASFRPLLGTIVHLKDDIPRLQWKMGKIVELVESSDGQVRSAKVRTAQRKILHRPIKTLYPLEEGPPDSVSAQLTEPDRPKTRNRPSRRAAKLAADRIRYHMEESDDE